MIEGKKLAHPLRGRCNFRNMAAVKAHGAHLPAEHVHSECFAAPAEAEKPSAAGARSLLEALEDLGIMVPFSCREGMRGTCETGVCSGEIEHHDNVLSDARRKAGKRMMIRVSRATSPERVIDL